MKQYMIKQGLPHEYGNELEAVDSAVVGGSMGNTKYWEEMIDFGIESLVEGLFPSVEREEKFNAWFTSMEFIANALYRGDGKSKCSLVLDSYKNKFDDNFIGVSFIDINGVLDMRDFVNSKRIPPLDSKGNLVYEDSRNGFDVIKEKIVHGFIVHYPGVYNSIETIQRINYVKEASNHP